MQIMLMPPPLQQVERTFVRVGGRKLVYFAGCDYFRLASHPQVLRAAETGLRRYGLNVAASRRTTGNHRLYEELEGRIAEYFGAESATLASSGYMPNLMAAQALAGEFSHALLDERAHGSLLDAAQLLNCPVLKFKHRDTSDLKKLLLRLGKVRPLVLTDGMFSHDGSIAPLKLYLAALPAGGMILLDDSHGAGVLGRRGRGTAEQAGVSAARIIRTMTLSKAFGVYGGAVLGSRKLRAAIVAKSRVFVGNTPLPLPLAAAAIKAVKILQHGAHLRARLVRNAEYVKGKLRTAGWQIEDAPGPIVPFTPRSPLEAEALRQRLLTRGIHPPFIKYPGGPASGYFRFAISSEHSPTQLKDLVATLLEVRSAG